MMLNCLGCKEVEVYDIALKQHLDEVTEAVLKRMSQCRRMKPIRLRRQRMDKTGSVGYLKGIVDGQFVFNFSRSGRPLYSASCHIGADRNVKVA